MAQPQRDDTDVNASLQQMRRRRVPYDVRRDVLFRQTRTGMHRAGDRFFQDAIDAIAGQLLAAVVGEQ